MFGKDHFFIELQNHGIQEQQHILPELVRLARELEIGLVATNDCHYLTKEDSLTQKILICIQTNHTLSEDNGMEFETEEFYVKSRQQMEQAMHECIFDEKVIQQALDNTVAIARRCQVCGIYSRPCTNPSVCADVISAAIRRFLRTKRLAVTPCSPVG